MQFRSQVLRGNIRICPVLKKASFCGIVFLCMLEGCIAPYALRADSVTIETAKNRPSFMVSPDWDYRKYYKIPPERLNEIIARYVGTPYRYGGSSAKGMDCSGFVNVVFTELNHARLPRTSLAMSRLGRPVEIKSGQPGDLVFFKTGILSRINHVGIYTGNGAFAHASRKKGVTFSELANDYYKKRFAGIRRLF